MHRPRNARGKRDDGLELDGLHACHQVASYPLTLYPISTDVASRKSTALIVQWENLLIGKITNTTLPALMICAIIVPVQVKTMNVHERKQIQHVEVIR